MRLILAAVVVALAATAASAGTLRVGAGAYRTIGDALKDLQPGDELVIAAGTYRETLRLPERDWSHGSTVIRGERAGAVLIKGSDVVTGWQPADGGEGSRGVFVRRNWTVNTQQVFVDGAPLQQIGGSIMNGYPARLDHPMRKLHESQGGIWPGRVAGGREQLVDDSFFYDETQQALYIRLRQGSPEGRSIEASVRPYIVFGKGLRRVTLRDLDMQHSNTTAVNQSGALTLLGDELRIERVNVSYTDGNGLDLTGDRLVVDAVTANYCGQVGLKVRGRGNRIANSVTNFNNTRGFNKWWEAGGAKFVGEGGLRDSEVVNHRAIGNRGDGIWFDWLNDNNQVHHSVVAYNTAGQTSTPSSQVSYTVPSTPTTSPTLTSVSPASGPTTGGTTITLTGTNFVSGATVRVGGAAATNVAFSSSTRLTARTPAGTAGAKDVVVTNPTHYAVALRYDEKKNRAPIVIAKGVELIALKIREIATEHGVPVIEAPPLARALHKSVELNREVPAALYITVAQVLTYVYQLKAARERGMAPPPAPVFGDVPGAPPPQGAG